MSQDSVERFLGRLLTDDEFRRCARSSFQQACLEQGFTFSGEEGEILQGIDFNVLASLAEGIDKRIKRSSRNL